MLPGYNAETRQHEFSSGVRPRYDKINFTAKDLPKAKILREVFIVASNSLFGPRNINSATTLKEINKRRQEYAQKR